MPMMPRSAIQAVLCGLAISVCAAQTIPSEKATSYPPIKGKAHNDEKLLSADDGLAVISAALDSRVPRPSERDCSHLVHAVYERAGFPYAYADSDDLYKGVEGFQRVRHPQPGDVIVWRGHAGIVVHPSRHVFFSFKTAGPATDDYAAPYWRRRGQPRFYRYVKNDPCPGCNSSNGTLRAARDPKQPRP